MLFIAGREQLVIVYQKLAELENYEPTHIFNVLLQKHLSHLEAHAWSREPSGCENDAVKSDHHVNGERHAHVDVVEPSGVLVVVFLLR